jgi:hypothetical protein
LDIRFNSLRVSMPNCFAIRLCRLGSIRREPAFDQKINGAAAGIRKYRKFSASK